MIPDSIVSPRWPEGDVGFRYTWYDFGYHLPSLCLAGRASSITAAS